MAPPISGAPEDDTPHQSVGSAEGRISDICSWVSHTAPWAFARSQAGIGGGGRSCRCHLGMIPSRPGDGRVESTVPGGEL